MLAVAVAAGAAGYLGWQTASRYEQGRDAWVADLNASLAPQQLQLNCSGGSAFSLWMLEEQCELRETGQNTVLASIRQHIRLLPWQIRSTFSIEQKHGMAGMLSSTLPGLLEAQQGEWVINAGDPHLYFHYQTGAVRSATLGATRVQLGQITLSGQTALEAPYLTRSLVTLPSLTVEQGDERLQLRSLSLSANTRQVQGVTLTERGELSLGSLEASSHEHNLFIGNLHTEQASLVEHQVLASLGTLSVDAVRFSSPEHDLRVDPSRFALYLDKLNWPALRRLQKQSGDPLENLMAIASHGVTLTLEELHSSFVYQDRRPDMLGTAGDIRLSGQLQLQPGDADSLLFDWPQRLQGTLDASLSPGLLLGPQAELMLEFTTQGWLQQDAERLRSRVQLQQGQVLANDRPVALGGAPVYEEDH